MIDSASTRVSQNNHSIVAGSTGYCSVDPDGGSDFLVTRLQNDRFFVNDVEFQ